MENFELKAVVVVKICCMCSAPTIRPSYGLCLSFSFKTSRVLIMIAYVLLWIPTHGRAKAGRPARTYIQQLCEDTGCCPEDLPRAMNDWDGERGSGISVLPARYDDDDDISEGLVGISSILPLQFARSSMFAAFLFSIYRCQLSNIFKETEMRIYCWPVKPIHVKTNMSAVLFLLSLIFFSFCLFINSWCIVKSIILLSFAYREHLP